MASLIKEEPPSNEVDLYKLIGDFLTDGMVYSKQDGIEICKKLNKIFTERNLREGYSDTLLAEKLSNPIVLKELSSISHHSEEEKYIDPLVGTDLKWGNYNTELPTSDKYKKLEEQKDLEKQKALDSIDWQIN